jgi:hypothetical protein
MGKCDSAVKPPRRKSLAHVYLQLTTSLRWLPHKKRKENGERETRSREPFLGSSKAAFDLKAKPISPAL